MSGQVVDPALLPQLSHDGVDEGETSTSLEGNRAARETGNIYERERERLSLIYSDANMETPLPRE